MKIRMVTVFDVETLGLDAFQHQIVLIGIKSKGRIKQWRLWHEKDELTMILECCKAFEKIPFPETIVGYNNLRFDVPFIVTRLAIHGKWSTDLWKSLYRDRKWLDLYQFLGNDFRKMSSWLTRLGIKRRYEDIMGRDVPRFYSEKKYKKISQHNKDDLEMCEELYLRLQEKFPELLRI